MAPGFIDLTWSSSKLYGFIQDKKVHICKRRKSMRQKMKWGLWWPQNTVGCIYTAGHGGGTFFLGIHTLGICVVCIISCVLNIKCICRVAGGGGGGGAIFWFVAASLISPWLLWWPPAESHYNIYDHSVVGYVSHAHSIVLLYSVGNKITTTGLIQICRIRHCD